MAGPVPWDAKTYDEVAAPQLAWGRRLMERRDWKGYEVVLDAGCGTGQLAEELLKKVPRGRIIAVDRDINMVALARRRLASYGARVRILQADVTRLVDVEPVDVIFSNAVLHWIPDHDAVFGHFFKLLKPGGELLIQCGGDGNLARVRAVASEVRHLPAFESHFRDWLSPWHYEDDASTTERLFITGYVHPEVSLEPSPVTFPDAETYGRFVRTVILSPYLHQFSDASLQDQFVREFLRRAEAAGLGRTLDYVRLNIRAQRPPHTS